MALPPLGKSPGSPGLGSLAQSARTKKLNQARWILIILGVLLLAIYAINLATLRDQARKAIAEEARKRNIIVDPVSRQELEDKVVRVGTIVCLGFMVVSVLFIVFGIVIKQIPVVATVVSMVLFIAVIAVNGILDINTLFGGIIWKILIFVGLIQAIQAAVAYQKEQSAIHDLEPQTNPYETP